MAASEGFGERHRSPGLAGEGLGDAERLGQEPLQPPRADHGEPVRGAQFVDAEQGDDVLQLLVMRNRLADLFGDTVMFLTNDVLIEQN